MARLASFWRQSGEPEALIRAREIALEGERAFPGSPGAALLPAGARGDRGALLLAPGDAGRRRRAALGRDRAPEPGEALPARLPARERAVRVEAGRLGGLERGADPPRSAPDPGRELDGRAAGDRRLPRPPHLRHAAARRLRRARALPDRRLGRRRFRTARQPAPGGRADALRRRPPPRLDARRGGRPARACARSRARPAAPLAGAEALLYQWQWEQKPQLVERKTTDAAGFVEFGAPGEARRGGGFTVVVRSQPATKRAGRTATGRGRRIPTARRPSARSSSPTARSTGPARSCSGRR